MIIARAAAMACLTVLKFMLYALGALLAVLAVVQALRGDDGAQPLTTVLGACVAAALGWGCGWAASRFEHMGRQ
jgi:drug/metabolite transporter (DMT)-like permease